MILWSLMIVWIGSGKVLPVCLETKCSFIRCCSYGTVVCGNQSIFTPFIFLLLHFPHYYCPCSLFQCSICSFHQSLGSWSLWWAMSYLNFIFITELFHLTVVKLFAIAHFAIAAMILARLVYCLGQIFARNFKFLLFWWTSAHKIFLSKNGGWRSLCGLQLQQSPKI